MSEAVKRIERQLENCRELLALFQSERNMYLESGPVSRGRLSETIERKQRIMEAFATQQSLIRELRNDESAPNDRDAKKRKSALRELAAALERLIVIDHENEKSLRDTLGTNRPRVGSNHPRGGARDATRRERPALRRRLPYVPGGVEPRSNRLVAGERGSRNRQRPSRSTIDGDRASKQDVAPPAGTQLGEAAKIAGKQRMRNSYESCKRMTALPQYA